MLELTDPSDVAVDGRRVWVLDRRPQPRALSVDPDRLEVDGEAFVGPDPRALAAGAGAIWVANTGDGTVSEVDPATATTVGRPIAIGGRPTDVAAQAGEVWVIDNFGGRLIPIDPSPPSGTPTAGEPTDTAARPRGVAIGFGSVWVSSGEDGTRSALRPVVRAASGDVRGRRRPGRRRHRRRRGLDRRRGQLDGQPDRPLGTRGPTVRVRPIVPLGALRAPQPMRGWSA